MIYLITCRGRRKGAKSFFGFGKQVKFLIKKQSFQSQRHRPAGTMKQPLKDTFHWGFQVDVKQLRKQEQ